MENKNCLTCIAVSVVALFVEVPAYAQEVIVGREDVRILQSRLNDLGFAVGAADGVAGPRTLAAARDAAAVFGLDASTLGPELVSEFTEIAESRFDTADSFAEDLPHMVRMLVTTTDIRLTPGLENYNVAPRILIAGDLDGDGRDEVVLTSDASDGDFEVVNVPTPMQILTGFNQAWPRLHDLPSRVLEREGVIEDFNGDGLNDLFIAASGWDKPPFPGEQNVLILSRGEEHEDVSFTNLPVIDDFAHGADASDIDGDGDQDLFVVTNGDRIEFEPYFLINDGFGNFKRSTAENHMNAALVDLSGNQRRFRPYYSTARFFDADGDGVEDLALLSQGLHDPFTFSEIDSTVILYGDGNGHFGRERLDELPRGKWGIGTFTNDLDPVDLDSDGLLDLVLTESFVPDPNNAGWRGQFVRILMRTSDGYVDRTHERMWPQQYENEVDQIFAHNSHLVDLDRDGDLDLVTDSLNPFWRNQPSDTPLNIGINDGSGRFLPAPPTWLDPSSGFLGHQLTPADRNGDGRPEILGFEHFGEFGDGPDRVFGMRVHAFRQ